MSGSIRNRLGECARSAVRDAVALYLAGRDPRVPRIARALAALTAVYALSPVDLIPDFIPLVGYLDDLVILPVLALLAVRLIPEDVMADLRRQAEDRLVGGRPGRRLGILLVVMAWLVLATAVGGVVAFMHYA